MEKAIGASITRGELIRIFLEFFAKKSCRGTRVRHAVRN